MVGDGGIRTRGEREFVQVGRLGFAVVAIDKEDVAPRIDLERADRIGVGINQLRGGGGAGDAGQVAFKDRVGGRGGERIGLEEEIALSIKREAGVALAAKGIQEGRNRGRENARRSVVVSAKAVGSRSRSPAHILASRGVVGNLVNVSVVIAAEIHIAVGVERSRRAAHARGQRGVSPGRGYLKEVACISIANENVAINTDNKRAAYGLLGTVPSAARERA